MRRPIHGCQHVAAITYGVGEARCEACGATWVRSSDGPWRLVHPGSRPDELEGYACEGCGAVYREAPRTCFLCGRPHGLRVVRSPVRDSTLVPAGEPDAGMRAD
jgi:hypothetical protein